MYHAKTLTAAILAGLLVTGCAGNSANVATQEDYNQAVVDAKAAIKKAKSARYEWRDSGKILKQAEKAAKAGDFNKAVKLANKAMRQGQYALAQSEQQKNAGPRL